MGCVRAGVWWCLGAGACGTRSAACFESRPTSSRPMTGSTFPRRARSVRSMEYFFKDSPAACREGPMKDTEGEYRGGRGSAQCNMKEFHEHTAIWHRVFTFGHSIRADPGPGLATGP
jgi:hypothetical protein